MKTTVATIGLLTSLAAVAQAGFSPIPINPASFNHDVVVEAGAPRALNNYVTATMDGGTNRTGNTWFENGYMGVNPTTGIAYTNGIPKAGTLLTNASGEHVYQMPADYHTNNVVLVCHQNGAKTPNIGGTLTLGTPATYSSLSFLNSSGNGPTTIKYTVHYQDGSSESGTFSSADWFGSGILVYTSSGRVSMGGGLQNIDGGTVKLWSNDVLLNSSSKVVSIDFANGNGNQWANGRCMVFSVSGSTDLATWSPINVSGYTFDGVVEADAAPTTGGAQGYGPVTNQVVGNLTNSVTVTMDGGIARTGNVWYERGYYSTLPDTGIPAAGSTFNSATLSASYTMPASYAGPCAAVVSKDVLTANITPATPGAYGALSFLCASANGDTFNQVILQFQDGSTETNYLFVPDWFDRNIPWSYRSFGRVNAQNRTINNSQEQFVNPFAQGLGTFDYRGLTLPAPQLMDAVINVTNSTGILTNIVMNFTNASTSTRVSAVLALSGAASGQVPPVFGTSGTPTPGQPNNAPVNNVSLIKRWEGTNNVVLSVTNVAGSSVSFQWMKAPRGGGLRDKFYSFDYSTFTPVTDGGRVSGSQSSVLVISNALVADSADYLMVMSNPYGAVTSTVATVEILTTNQSLLVGQAFGDQIQGITGEAYPAAESIDHVIDRVAQKWLSNGQQNSGNCCGGVLPWGGPVAFQVIPVSGATVIKSLRFYTANDSQGRDPFDYGLEGSNDQNTWTTITGGQLKGTLSLPTTRGGTGSAVLDPLNNNYVTEVDFNNNAPYTAYRMWITNNYDGRGNALMQVAEIEFLGTLVPNPPVWVRQPDPSSVIYAGSSVSAYAVATSYPAPKYQWYNGSTAIAGATTTSYTITNITLGASGTVLSCVASNNFGAITSTTEVISVVPDPTNTYPAAVLANNPVGYWRLNEGPDDNAGDNGVVTHDYVGGHNGYYSNAVINVTGYNTLSDTDTAAGFGTLASIDSYVANINDVDFSRPTNSSNFSIEAWVQGVNQTVPAAIVTKGYNGILNVGTGTGTEQFVLDVASGSSQFRFLVRDAAGNGHVAQSTITPGDPVSGGPAWHHLVGVCDQANGSVYLYVDGLLAGTGTIPATAGIQAQPLPMTIGARKNSGSAEYDNQWTGTIDEVAAYRTALTPAQVIAHYYGGQRGPLMSLQPTNQTISEGLTLTMPAGAYGSGTVAYQWYLSNGTTPTTPVAGQTASNLTFVAAAAQNGNYYQLVATTAFGSVTSAPAQLTVLSGPPTFQVDLPSSSTYLLGHTIILHVVPGGTVPFTYQWKKNGSNISDDYRTYGSTSDTLVIGYANPGDNGNYTVVVSNARGNSTSTTDAITVITSSGGVAFNAAANGWSLQGTTPPVMGDGTLQLTASLGSTARSAFMTTALNVGAFVASYIYTDTTGSGGADGVTFCIQNSGPSALGGGGGGLGYSGITPSVALAFNIYSPNTQGIGLLQGGAVTTPFTPIGAVGVGANTDPIQVNLSYNGAVLSATFKDTVSGATYSTNLTVNIPSILGSSTGYFGFTGADGGVASTQVISSFSMAPVASQLKLAIVGNNLVLSWPTSTAGVLMSSSSLTNPTWAQDTDNFRIVGNNATVTVPIGGGKKFFRLQIYP